MISVAVATHNGARYVEEQFESLFSQTRLPDEVVVYDDASSDETPDILSHLQARAPFQMKIILGEANQHVNGAFGRALIECSGEIVLFCDQDDIWAPTKIDRIQKCFERDQHIGMVFSDASQIDSEGRELEQTLWESVHFNKRRQARFESDPVSEVLRGGNFIYGMASAFRTDCLSSFLPIQANPRGMTHDTWFALHTLSCGWHGVLVEDKLVRYRRHGGQTTKASSKEIDPRQRRRTSMLALIEALQLVRSNIEATLDTGSEAAKHEALKKIADKIDHLSFREQLRDQRSFRLAMRALISTGYWRFAKGPYSVLRDFSGL